MTDYKTLIEALRGLKRSDDEWAAADAIEALLDVEQRLTDHINQLAAERDEAVKQLSESRANTGDMEARVVELEAVVAEALKRHDSGPTHDILSGATCWWADADGGGSWFPHDFYDGACVNCFRREEGLRTPSVILADHDAAVWDEGYEAGADDEAFKARGLDTDPGAADHPHANPYRGDNR